MSRLLKSFLTAGVLFVAAVVSVAELDAHRAAGAVPVNPENAQRQKRRNIIFILVDDLRYDGMGFLQPRIHTPNIDRMAREGSYFPNAMVTSSLCSPSRATILTGMSARNHGVIDNNNSTEAGLIFFPKYLQQAGYQTALIGKWHMGDDTDAPRQGFDKWVSFRGQGAYYPTTGVNLSAAAAGRVNMLNVDGREVPQKGYITDELTDYAMNWLEKERDPNKPFMLYLSHKAVHNDPLPPPRYVHQYDKVTFPLPASAANTPENYRGKPRWVYDQRNSWHGIDFSYNSDVPMGEYLKYYYATLSAVDDSLGRIFAYLKEHHLEQDTLVVFTSDNGFQIGEHGLIDKRNAYEASIRVPLVVWEPETIPAGVTNPGRIRNIDFAPTFLEVAGVPAPKQFEGKSTWSLMNGSLTAPQWNPPDFIYEYYWEYNFPMTPGTFAIERDGLKYIEYYGVYDTDELYNLRDDPDEMHNLVDERAYQEQKMKLRQALYEQLADRNGRHVIPYGMRQSIGAVRRSKTGTGAAPFPDSWLVEPNRPDRLDGFFPDSPAKLKAHDAGKPFVPSLSLPESIKRDVESK